VDDGWRFSAVHEEGDYEDSVGDEEEIDLRH
jgi:hypothetical protein